MPGLVVKGFGGLVPRTASLNLPDNMAEEAVNCDLQSGELVGLPQLELVIDLSPRLVRDPVTGMMIKPLKAYRLPPKPGVDAPDAWLPLPSPYSCVCRSPLTNDVYERIYWTNPDDNNGPWTINYVELQSAVTPYNVGVVQPDLSIVPTVTTVGGDTTVPAVARSYVYTFVNGYGEESAPSVPSVVVAGPPDATWVISGLPSGPPAAPPGKNYFQVDKMRLYRTLTSQTQGAQFYKCGEWGVPPGAPPVLNDNARDEEIVNNILLVSTDYANPPEGLDGLIALPGGMMVGFTDNTLHFCEPYQPHAWPAKYDISVVYNIIALALWQQSLVVITNGPPSTGAGNSPANYQLTQVQVAEPCIARGSVITDLMGVYYASQNGLVMLNYYGMQNQTLSLFTKNIWLTEYHADKIIACRHRSQYLAITGEETGFIIDYAEQRLGVMKLTTFEDVVSIWNDEYNGSTYAMADGKVLLWDSPTSQKLMFRWRSKQFFRPMPENLGAAYVSLHHEVLNILPPYQPPCECGDDPLLRLPDGVNAQFRVFDGSDPPQLRMTRNLSKCQEIFRLPSGFKAFNYQFEVVSRVPISFIRMAPTLKELRSVG